MRLAIETIVLCMVIPAILGFIIVLIKDSIESDKESAIKDRFHGDPDLLIGCPKCGQEYTDLNDYCITCGYHRKDIQDA